VNLTRARDWLVLLEVFRRSRLGTSIAFACRTLRLKVPVDVLAAILYERHEPEKTLLHEVIRDELEPFLARARGRGAPVARFVEREIRAYLECGVLAHGFLRVHCDACGHDRLVAFSCKCRGFCPSCGGRRMANTAAWLVDRVLPNVPVRQWVLTLPYPLRYRCAWDARLMTEVLRAFLRSTFTDQRRRARRLFGVPRGLNGSVTFIQRFGSALNLTPHFHVLVLDGVYPGSSHDLGPFVPLPPPETEDVARVLTGTARRIIRIVERRGLDNDEDSLASDEPLLDLLTAASIRSRIATGPEAGDRWRRLGDRVEPMDREEGGIEPDAGIPPRCVREGGMSLHADVAVPGGDRRRLERLCRYVARPPLALDRLEAMADGRLAYRLKTRWRDGTTHVLMERHELLERLAPLIPPPRAHQVRYHGVLAPCASGRSRVVPMAQGREANFLAACNTGNLSLTAEVEDESSVRSTIRPHVEELGAADSSDKIVPLGPDRHPIGGLDATRCASERREGPILQRRLAWADLLQRVFEVDALACPKCGGRMRVLSAITDPIVAARILRCLSLPARAPPLAAAREKVGPRDSVGELSSEVTPEFDFDQSRSSDDGEHSA